MVAYVTLVGRNGRLGVCWQAQQRLFLCSSHLMRLLPLAIHKNHSTSTFLIVFRATLRSMLMSERHRSSHVISHHARLAWPGEGGGAVRRWPTAPKGLAETSTPARRHHAQDRTRNEPTTFSEPTRPTASSFEPLPRWRLRGDRANDPSDPTSNADRQMSM